MREPEFISQGFPDHAIGCIERLYKEFLKYENLYQKEVLAREKLEKELKELKN